MGSPLAEDDYLRAAEFLGCEEAALRAVVAVESSGRAYDIKGRPTALFEKHYFHRQLAANPELQEQAVSRNLARPEWIPGDYPTSADGVWWQIAQACEISEDSALQSVSWGLGQVMGTFWVHHPAYNSVNALVVAMWASAGAQLDLMVAFIRTNKLDKALADHNWTAFARGYNGPSYHVLGYDQKMAATYARITSL